MVIRESFSSSKTGKPLSGIRVLRIVIGATLLSYCFFAAGLCVFLNTRSSREHFSFLEVAAIPFRWPAFKEERGKRHIEEGLRLFARNDWKSAAAHLRIGLARAPADGEARLALAQIYVRARRGSLAKSTLLAGLPYAGANPAYVRQTLEFLLGGEDDTTVIDAAKIELARSDLSPDVIKLFQIGAATAAFFRGHYDEAEDWLTSPEIENSVAARLLFARIDWETGYNELALQALRQIIDEPGAAADAYDLLIRYLRVQRSYSAIRGLSLARQLAFPTAIRPRLDYLYACEQSGDTRRAQWETRALVREFADEPSAAAALGEYAAETANIPLARALVAHVSTAPEPVSLPARLALVETLIAAREFKSALDELNSLATRPRATLGWSTALREGLHAVAYAGLGDQAAAQLHLSAFLAMPNVRAETVVAIARHLQEAGSVESARQALESALRVDSLNQSALMRLVELDLAKPNLDALADHMRAYVQTRKPAQTLIATAREKLASDAFLFSAQRSSVLELLRRADAISPRPRRSS